MVLIYTSCLLAAIIAVVLAIIQTVSFYGGVNAQENDYCDRIFVNMETEKVIADFLCLQRLENQIDYTFVRTNDTNDLSYQKIMHAKCENLPLEYRGTTPLCRETCDGKEVLSEGQPLLEITFSQKESTALGGHPTGTSVNFSCNGDHLLLQGASSTYCDGNGSWKKFSRPKCEATCAAILPNSSTLIVHYEPLAINGGFESFLNERFRVNTIAKFSCDTYHGILYQLVGESTSVCKKNGEWAMIQEPHCVPTCAAYQFVGSNNEFFWKVKVDGKNFTDISTGDIRYRAGSLGTVTCRDNDMTLTGEAQTICLRNGSWTDPGHLKCEKTCPKLLPSSIINHNYNKESLASKSLPERYSPGTKITTNCKNSTNQLIGPKEMLCTDEGIWKGYQDEMLCVATCEKPYFSTGNEDILLINSSFSHSVLEEPKDRFPFGTIVTHECSRNGLKMNGSRTQKCRSNGEWDGISPTCVADIEKSASSSQLVKILVPVFTIGLLIGIAAAIMFYIKKCKGHKGCSRFIAWDYSKTPISNPEEGENLANS